MFMSMVVVCVLKCSVVTAMTVNIILMGIFAVRSKYVIIVTVHPCIWQACSQQVLHTVALLCMRGVHTTVHEANGLRYDQRYQQRSNTQWF